MKVRSRWLALVALTAGSAALAQDPAYLPFRMLRTATNPFPYYLDNRAPAPASLAVTASRPAVEAAWATWNGLTCAMPKAVSQGFTAGNVPSPEDQYDAFNVTPVWVTSASSAIAKDLLSDGFALAFAFPNHFGGVLQTCDIFVSGTGTFRYSVDAVVPEGLFDVQSVMTHEIGHCLGLDHFGLGVMAGSARAGETVRALTQLDARGLCERNPALGLPGAECFADGGCEGTNKCTSRTGNTGPPRYCTNGCTPNTTPCAFPLECLPSAQFRPNANDSCQYTSTTPTQVGRPCMSDPQCGSALGYCIMPGQTPSQTPLWEGGYCSQTCEPGQPPCPAGSQCLPDSQGRRFCIQSCRVGLADCRPEYTCDALFANSGGCIPKCRVNADCGMGTECRLCDGRCVPVQTPGVAIGTICTQDTQCGLGQLCRQVDQRSPIRQCTVPCSRGCTMCPSGAACLPDARGELYCLRTCSGPRSCGQGLRCNDFPGVKACIPACTSNADCPVGQTCQEQECVLPVDPEDAGCGVFCNVPDAGRPMMPRPDGGVMTGGGNAGCACSSASFDALLGVAGLGLWLARRRRP